MVTSRLGRLATWVAVVVLLVNAMLLGAAGVVGARPALLAAGAGLLAGAGLVVVAWRRHRRRLAELTADREALRDEALALRDLVRGRH